MVWIKGLMVGIRRDEVGINRSAILEHIHLRLELTVKSQRPLVWQLCNFLPRLSETTCMTQLAGTYVCVLLAVVTCPIVSSPTHGSISLTSVQLVLGTQVRFSCDTGFHLDGDKVLFCTEHGNWSAPLPTCTGECPSLWHSRYRSLGEGVGSTRYQEL